MTDFHTTPFAKKYKAKNDAKTKALQLAKEDKFARKALGSIPKNERRDDARNIERRNDRIYGKLKN